MSEANDSAQVSDERSSVSDGEVHQHVDIHIDRGNPTHEEVAALVVVLGGASGGTRAPTVPARNMWGHPVGRLRYAACSWERVTLLERTYMRR